jgi:hypothetical protein
MWLLAAAPEQSVSLLQRRLRPISRADAWRTEQLIAALDSADASIREQAARQLEALQEAAAGPLRQALARKPTLEVRRRITTLVGKLEEPGRSGEGLRALRAVEVLEQIGTPDAQVVLRALAKGLPEARLTQEAKASLERLAKRLAAKP